MDNIAKKVSELRGIVNDAKIEESKVVGALEQVFESMEEKFGVSDLDQAEQLESEKQGEASETESKLKKHFEELTEQFEW